MADDSHPRNRPDRTEVAVGMDEQSSTTLRQWVFVRHKAIWQPPTDVYEFADRLIIIVEVAGMRDSDIHITLQGQLLTISGIREHIASEGCAYNRLEIRYGEFRTEVTIPWPPERSGVMASYRDGFLRVELPRALPHKIHAVAVERD